MAFPELLRRWLPVALLTVGVGLGVYFKRRPKPVVEDVVTREIRYPERCDELGWCAQALPGGAPQKATYAAAWVAGADDAWVVGLSGVAVRWDGADWSSVPTNSPTLRGVYGFATNDVWLVGGARALHWDGTQITPHELTLRGELTAVFGTAPDDVWTVTSSGEAVHWNGAAWRVVATPFTGSLEAVWGAAPNDYWAAGSKPDGDAPAVIAHWDGRTWTTSVLPCRCSVTALSGTDATDVWAVADAGNLLHYEGEAWRQLVSPTNRTLTGVAAHARNDVWAVGVDNLLLRFDGVSWREVASAQQAAQSEPLTLNAVAVTPSDVWTVGQDGWISRRTKADFVAPSLGSP